MIGIFDSGAGGLSVYREIRKILPEQDCIYYSDNANCPYGPKPKEFIIRRAKEITEFLLSEGADIIVVACNTATAIAIKSLREDYPAVRFIGMEPAIKPAAQSTLTGAIGVLATAGTLCSEKYLRHKEKYAGDICISEHTGEGFVELVEKGTTTGPEAESTVRSSLMPLLDEGADMIVLGCTHYPFLSETISKVAESLTPDRKVTIIDPAPAVARHLLDVMTEQDIIKREGFSLSLHASGDDSVLKNMAERL
jgi:glutamate racemase